MTEQAASEKKQKTSAEVQSEINNLAFRAGFLQYEVLVKTRDLEMFNETLGKLSVEFHTLKQTEEAAAKASEETKK